MDPAEEVPAPQDTMILPQLGITNGIIKKYFPDKVVTIEFKK